MRNELLRFVKRTMRSCLFLWILMKQTFDFSASQDFYFLQRLEGESVDILCVAPANKSQPLLLYLRRRFAHSESVMKISEDADAASQGSKGNVWISDQLSSRVTVTLSHLRHEDTGLYICDFSGEPSVQLSASTSYFLLVNKAGEVCSCRRFALLIYSSSAGVALLLLALAAVVITQHKKPRSHDKPQTTFSIYEDMSKLSSVNHLQIHPSNVKSSAPGRTDAQGQDYAGPVGFPQKDKPCGTPGNGNIK